MTQCDSESSDLEEDDYTETHVLLGYASSEACDDISCHLGGLPDWIDPDFPPSITHARCKICNDLMVLLLQLNGNLPEYFPGHIRRLYLWICRRRTCKHKDGSVRALRGVQVLEGVEPNIQEPIQEDIKPSKKSDINLGEHLFASNPCSTPQTTLHCNGNQPSNPFAKFCSRYSSNPVSEAKYDSPMKRGGRTASSIPDSLNNLPKTFAESLYIVDSSPKLEPINANESWPQVSEFPPMYPLIYLVDTDFETLDLETKHPLTYEKANFDDYQKNLGNEKEDKIVFESSLDQTFQKFAARLGQNPEQVIRYEFKGQPLLYSKNDYVGNLFTETAKENSKITLSSGNDGRSRLPRCQNCGANRVFEFQLTPQAITELERGKISIEDGMDWGTIMIGVCESDCQQQGVSIGVGYVEEWVGVQWEEFTRSK